MNIRADKKEGNKSQSLANKVFQKRSASVPTFQFVDKCPKSIAQRKLQEIGDNSTQVKQLMAFQKMANDSPQAKNVVQLQAMSGTGSPVFQRVTGMEEEDWSQESAANFMMNKQTKQNDEGEEVADLAGQNKANASIWYNTMFSKGLAEEDPGYNADQERVLQEQQAMLKRHFLAQAVFGVQGGAQYKEGAKQGKVPGRRTRGPETEEDYQPIESFQQDGVSANLATLASGGGRFNYRSTDGSGEDFNKFLMGTDNLDNVRDTTNNHGGRQPATHMGAYKRIGTHGESFKDGYITEVDKKTGGIDSTGFDIPIGGVGQILSDTEGREVTTGYQGVSEANRRGRRIGNGQKEYQTGHGFHRHATNEDRTQSLTQIAFEGSGPHMDNIHGGSHGIMATVGKKILGNASEKTLTGQDKRSKLGLPMKVGGIKADVTLDGMASLAGTDNILKRIQQSDNPEIQALEKKYYKQLLTTTTHDERAEILEAINSHKAYFDDKDEEMANKATRRKFHQEHVRSRELQNYLAKMGPNQESKILLEQVDFNHPLLEKARAQNEIWQAENASRDEEWED